MFDYTISGDNNPKKFKEACVAVEKLFPKAEKKKLLIDVDGTTIQTFNEHGRSITIYDDYDVGAVFVKSEIDLGKLFA
ncbi:MAG: hypothetical protein K2N29_00700 [Ruminiclostridium sp.]|nr:hypothetical protein [Ruminiclostridium sp.]